MILNCNVFSRFLIGEESYGKYGTGVCKQKQTEE